MTGDVRRALSPQAGASFNGTSWSLLAFGPDTCSQIAQYAVTIFDVVAPDCPADLDGDGAIGETDLTALLAAWGTASSDIDGDGNTGGTDLTALLAAWGPCA